MSYVIEVYKLCKNQTLSAKNCSKMFITIRSRKIIGIVYFYICDFMRNGVDFENIYKTVSEGREKEWSQHLAAITSAAFVLTSGMYTEWPSSSLSQLIFDFTINLSQTDIINLFITSTVGAIIGSFLFLFLSDSIGRKPAVLLLAVPQIVSFAIMGFSFSSIEYVFIGRFFGGMSECASIFLVSIYISEIAETANRCALVSLVGTFWLFGMFLIDVIGSHFDLETASFVSLAFPVLAVFGFFNMPESPYYLVMKNKLAKAASALKMLRQTEDVSKELGEIQMRVAQQTSEKLGVFKAVKLLFVAITLSLIYQMTGVKATNFGNSSLFNAKRFGFHYLFLLPLFANLVSYFWADRVEKRRFLLSSLAVVASCLTFLAVVIYWDENSTLDLTSINNILLLVVILYSSSFSCGLGTFYFHLIAETFPITLKTKFLPVVASFFAISGFVSFEIYHSLIDFYGLGVAYSFFAVCTWLGLFFCWNTVSETSFKASEGIHCKL